MDSTSSLAFICGGLVSLISFVLSWVLFVRFDEERQSTEGTIVDNGRQETLNTCDVTNVIEEKDDVIQPRDDTSSSLDDITTDDVTTIFHLPHCESLATTPVKYIMTSHRGSKSRDIENSARLGALCVDESQWLEDTTIVTSQGGLLCVAGCQVHIPPNIFEQDAKMKLKCLFTSHEESGNTLVISPIITIDCDVEVNDRKLPLTVTMPTCYAARRDDRPIGVKVEYQAEGVWRHLAFSVHGDSRYVTFVTNALGTFRAILPQAEFDRSLKFINSVGFVKRAGESPLDVVWCLCDDSSPLVAKLWLEMAPQSTYQRIIEPRVFCVGCDDDLTIKIDTAHGDVTTTSYKVGRDDSWGKILLKKFVFRFRNPSDVIKTYVVNNQWDNVILRGDVAPFKPSPNRRHCDVFDDDVIKVTKKAGDDESMTSSEEEHTYAQIRKRVVTSPKTVTSPKAVTLPPRSVSSPGKYPPNPTTPERRHLASVSTTFRRIRRRLRHKDNKTL